MGLACGSVRGQCGMPANGGATVEPQPQPGISPCVNQDNFYLDLCIHCCMNSNTIGTPGMTSCMNDCFTWHHDHSVLPDPPTQETCDDACATIPPTDPGGIPLRPAAHVACNSNNEITFCICERELRNSARGSNAFYEAAKECMARHEMLNTFMYKCVDGHPVAKYDACTIATNEYYAWHATLDCIRQIDCRGNSACQQAKQEWEQNERMMLGILHDRMDELCENSPSPIYPWP